MESQNLIGVVLAIVFCTNAFSANNPHTIKTKTIEYKSVNILLDSEPQVIKFNGLFDDLDKKDNVSEELSYKIIADTKAYGSITQPKGIKAEEFLFSPVVGAVGVTKVKIIAEDVIKAATLKVVSYEINVNVIRPKLFKFEDLSFNNGDVQQQISLAEKFSRVSQVTDITVSSKETDKNNPVIKDVIFENDKDKTLHILLTKNAGTGVVIINAKTANGEVVSDSFNVTVKANDRLKKFNYDNNAIAWLELGVQNLPEYEEGESQGFSGSRGFGRFTYNERLPDAGDSCSTWFLCSAGDWGVRMTLSAKPVFNEDGDEDTTIPREFNDISDTVDVEVYRNWSVFNGSNWMYGVSMGAVNREKVSENLDRLNYHYGVGISYQSPLQDYMRTQPSNGIPNTYLSFKFTRVEDYGGFGKGSYNERLISEFRYRIPETAVQLVFESNAGKGPDEIYVGASILFNPSHLIKMFGVEL